MHRLFNTDSLEWLAKTDEAFICGFADPPDNIGLGYDGVDDKKPAEEYVRFLRKVLNGLLDRCDTVWFSFNAKWTFEVGRIVCDLLEAFKHLEAKPCVQTYTFGQHSHADLGNNHRPLWRLRHKNSSILYPDQIRVPSWRQENGDKRADPRGRVPGDVFDFTRVTGNSKQRRSWHPTQLNEGLVERCIKFSTLEGQPVLDPFGGTGTTLRVCKAIHRPCTLLELSPEYCKRIAAEHGLEIL
jgi:site-specific DNA-methyltransferase (adenine-specific)